MDPMGRILLDRVGDQVVVRLPRHLPGEQLEAALSALRVNGGRYVGGRWTLPTTQVANVYVALVPKGISVAMTPALERLLDSDCVNSSMSSKS